MDAGSALIDELPDRGVADSGLEQLDESITGLEAADPGSVTILQLGLGHSEDIAIK